MPITEKEKAAILDRLAAIRDYNQYSSPLSGQNIFCLAIIAACMLENQPTVEDIARYHKKRVIHFVAGNLHSEDVVPGNADRSAVSAKRG